MALTPNELRDQAERLRTVAMSTALSPAGQRTAATVAEQYYRLAEMAEERERVRHRLTALGL